MCALLSAHICSSINILHVFAFPACRVSAPFSPELLAMKGNWAYDKTALQGVTSSGSSFHAFPDL